MSQLETIFRNYQDASGTAPAVPGGSRSSTRGSYRYGYRY